MKEGELSRESDAWLLSGTISECGTGKLALMELIPSLAGGQYIVTREMNVWQPNSTQWWIIWIVAVVLILSWPPDKGRSLALKATNWLADPSSSLPTMPDPLPIGLDDNGDAVTAHDAQETEYQQLYASSRIIRLRLSLKTATDPFDPTTERQILSGIAILAALVIWRINVRTIRSS